MTDARPALAKLATDALAAERLQTSEPTPMQRARAIALLASTITSEARTRRRRRVIFGLGAAAAAAGAILTVGALRHRNGPANDPPPVAANAPSITGSAHALNGDVALVHDGQQIKLDGPQTLQTGDHVVAPRDARAAITLSTGTHLVVEAGGDLGVVEEDDTQIFALQSGAVHADVAKLQQGQRFLIRTRDAEIEVRGTSFELSVVPSDPSCGGGTITRLVVSEGLVMVRNGGVETNVGAGDVWPRGCGTAANDEAPTPEPAALAATPATPPIAKAADVAPKTASEIAASELAAQNDLFAQASAKKNSGDVPGAVSAYERYLAKYPGGPLAESATVERMRLLASIDPARGAVAAKAYLAHYPKGFARVEAERLASGAP
jgi:ferric-dicitrate binding protein FerR (iron transport regulator)